MFMEPRFGIQPLLQPGLVLSCVVYYLEESFVEKKRNCKNRIAKSQKGEIAMEIIDKAEEALKNAFLSIPFVKRIVDHVTSIPTHMVR